MLHQEFTFSLHKTNFHGETWQIKNPKATVIIVHGMGEHLGRYNHLAKFFTEKSLNVIAYDNFGHGKSSGKRGHNPSYKALLDVIDFNIEKAKILAPNKPVFLYGHSMGGNLVINYSLKRNQKLKGIIATSPFLRLAFNPPAWKLKLGRILQKVAPSVTLGNEININHLSRDESANQQYKNDALVHNKISANYSLSILDNGKWAIENIHKLSVPMLISHGTIDKITSHEASKELSKKSNLIQLELIEGGYHELQNDICKNELFSIVENWINQYL